MAVWCCLGQAASIAQLAGVDASGLISMIVKAVQTVRRNNEECQQLARRVEMIDGLLQRLQDSEMTQHPETWMPLRGLAETLRRAYVLVASCQRSGYAYRFCMGCRLADQFSALQKEMDDYLDYLQLLLLIITYDDFTRQQREILNAVGKVNRWEFNSLRS